MGWRGLPIHPLIRHAAATDRFLGARWRTVNAACPGPLGAAKAGRPDTGQGQPCAVSDKSPGMW